MQNHILDKEESLLRRRLIPLADSQLDNLPSTSRAAISASISGCNGWQLIEDPLSSCLLLEERGFSGWDKPIGSASKRSASPKVDPDYNPKTKLGSAPRGMMTRGQLKKDQAMLDGPPAGKEPKVQPKPKPKPKTASLRRFRTGQRLMPTVWHSGEVCHHALRQIGSPEARQASESDVERWRAIESICLDLRGINVRGDVGVLKGPVSFEDVFQVLGLNEQGEAKVDPTPLPEVKVDTPGKAIEVVSSSECFGIEKYLMPPLTPIQSVTRPARKPRARRLPTDPKPQTKSSRPRGKRTTKSTYRRPRKDPEVKE